MIPTNVTQNIQDAKDSLDLWHAFILGLPALAGVIATLIVTLRGQKKASRYWQRAEKDATETLYQVQNEHSENLRDEITRSFNEVRNDIRTMRDELHVERKERIEGDKRGNS